MALLQNLEEEREMHLLDRLSTLLPGKKIYFIYTHNNHRDRFRYGLKANTEISYFSLSALKRRFPRVIFLRLQGEKESRIASINSKDVVIGHVGETFLRASARTSRLIAFYPWSGHEDRSVNTLFNCLPLSEEKVYWERAASIILLTSEYNVREYIEKQSNFWYPYYRQMRLNKPIHVVHQPLDLSCFPRIKWEYTTSDFLYVGNDAHMKCLPDSQRLVESLNRRLSLYGVGEKRLDNLDKTQVERLAREADFFIQPGMWEGQCVALLEAAARGFIPVVSPQTGYPYDHPFLLRHDDFAYNQKILQALLKTDPDERRALADHLHKQLREDPAHNSWENLTDLLVSEVARLRC